MTNEKDEAGVLAGVSLNWDCVAVDYVALTAATLAAQPARVERPRKKDPKPQNGPVVIPQF